MSNALSEVENGLYKRMTHNAFKGFLKNGVWGLLLGAAIGAAIFAFAPLAMTALVPTAFAHLAVLMTAGTATAAGVAGAATSAAILAHASTGAIILAGALTSASIVGTAGASFGAVAGIQSTRDARRYLGAHEIDRPTRLSLAEDPLGEVKSAVKQQGLETSRSVSYRDIVRSETPGERRL